MDASSHPVVVEYAVRELFKKKSPRRAALTTKEKLSGSTNLFIGGGESVVEIDEHILEQNLWKRIADVGRRATSGIKPEKQRWVLEGVLESFGQKPTAKNTQKIEVLIGLG
jgi:hypothetical protein